MAQIDKIIDRLKKTDPVAAQALQQEHNANKARRKFGLVYETHGAEIFEHPTVVAKKNDWVRIRPERGQHKGDKDLWKVVKTYKNNDGHRYAVLQHEQSTEGHVVTRNDVLIEDLVVVTKQDMPIYPGLIQDGEVVGNPDSDIYHSVINGENYEVLRALTFTHQGAIDAIYIDPPYNTGSRDWKYNNDYVDGSDQFRSSAFLNFLEKRLNIAKKLLNPDDSVLILTIDEKEYLNVGILLRQVFPEARIQMISSVINPGGSARKSMFSRSDEYIYFVFVGDASVQKCTLHNFLNINIKNNNKALWGDLTRAGTGGTRDTAKNLFYPIFYNIDKEEVHSVGKPLARGVDRRTVRSISDEVVPIFPINSKGKEMRWGISREKFLDYLVKGYIKYGKYNESKLQPVRFSYLRSGDVEKADRGELIRNELGDWEYVNEKLTAPVTTWNMPSHNATVNGSNILSSLFDESRFDYPKSLYAVEDALRFFVKNKPNATILDFFGGSGTTMHAVMRLNKQDDGRRKCIIVTNNEIGEPDEKRLTAQGIRPGDPEWEALGIAEYATKPRIKAAITGKTAASDFTEPVKGNYRYNDEFSISDGLKQNARFFTLNYNSKSAIEYGYSDKYLLPLLWMSGGCQGDIPAEVQKYYIGATWAVLRNTAFMDDFVHHLHPDITKVYVIGDEMKQQELSEKISDSNITVDSLWSNYVAKMDIQVIK